MFIKMKITEISFNNIVNAFTEANKDDYYGRYANRRTHAWEVDDPRMTDFMSTYPKILWPNRAHSHSIIPSRNMVCPGYQEVYQWSEEMDPPVIGIKYATSSQNQWGVFKEGGVHYAFFWGRRSRINDFIRMVNEFSPRHGAIGYEKWDVEVIESNAPRGMFWYENQKQFIERRPDLNFYKGDAEAHVLRHWRNRKVKLEELEDDNVLRAAWRALSPEVQERILKYA